MTERGIAKMYLKPSQYVWCFLEKSGYKYNEPMKDTFGDIEKRYPVKRYNNLFDVTAKKYEKNGFTIAYPAFIEWKTDELDSTEALKIFKEIIGGITESEKSKTDSEDRDKKFTW